VNRFARSHRDGSVEAPSGDHPTSVALRRPYQQDSPRIARSRVVAGSRNGIVSVRHVGRVEPGAGQAGASGPPLLPGGGASGMELVNQCAASARRRARRSSLPQQSGSAFPYLRRSVVPLVRIAAPPSGHKRLSCEDPSPMWNSEDAERRTTVHLDGGDIGATLRGYTGLVLICSSVASHFRRESWAPAWRGLTCSSSSL